MTIYVVTHYWNSRNIDGEIVGSNATVVSAHRSEKSAKKAVKEGQEIYKDGYFDYHEIELED